MAVFGQRGFIAPQEIDDIFRRRPELRAAGVRDAGHDVHLDHPAALHQVVRHFLDEAIGGQS